ncbi:homoserine kinase [Sansalvadorimonas sp. 2012CJ34-2]|uniref:Homoserine kinase n=1 Tax=Parendozoicomonas callyspongiae TaxID=2942213 RepID=A0ABT0PAQ4_9GAMM|nr:homoserine kinase [Sansalvadorimonas sp. 2012CJ34-2]MCL6268474.1 homoserine kinase [Sansalvadorimonas sp. 2012CJ34-2]
MSVYTQLSEQDFRSFLALYDEGNLVSWKGIEAGVENTNYFVHTLHPEKGEQNFVLTIFEYQPKELLPFFINFMEILADSGLPVPSPIHGLDDKPLRIFKNKPCLLQARLSGHHIDKPDLTAAHCAEIGKNLARAHAVGLKASFSQDNMRGIQWIDQQVTRMTDLLSEEDSLLQTQQWKEIKNGLAKYPDLPKGLIHADLFVDNVLFEDDKVTGMIDFFQSCRDCLLYDVAVTVNDWCLTSDSLELDPDKTKALLEAYNQVRPFTDEERRAWHLMHRLSCLRFWISRLVTFVYPEEGSEHLNDQGAIRKFKDPDEFRDMLELRTAKSFSLILPS